MTDADMNERRGAANGDGRLPIRITLPSPDEMSGEQREVYDKVINGPRGSFVGPLRAVIHSPELADRWQLLGEYVRYRTVLPEELKELAILVSARRWNSQLEWTIHRGIGEKAGLPLAVLEALRRNEQPVFDDPAQVEIHEYARELQMHGRVGDGAYLAIKERWGERGVVELTAIIGYYTMVAMMLNAHRVPLPDGAEPDLVLDGDAERALSTLSPAAKGRRD